MRMNAPSCQPQFGQRCRKTFRLRYQTGECLMVTSTILSLFSLNYCLSLIATIYGDVSGRNARYIRKGGCISVAISTKWEGIPRIWESTLYMQLVLALFETAIYHHCGWPVSAIVKKARIRTIETMPDNEIWPGFQSWQGMPCHANGMSMGCQQNFFY